MILAAGALFAAAPAPPLPKRPMWELSDAQLCEAARQTAEQPGSNVADLPGFLDFGKWEVDCEARVLRMPLTVVEPGADRMVAEAFTRPDFCDAPNLGMLWSRGWHFEMRFRFSDGSTEITRPCDAPGIPAASRERL